MSNIISKTKKDYVYIGYNRIYKENILNKFYHVNTIINKKYYKEVNFKYACWFSLDKLINSGLHHDDTNNIIYVLDGKKTIYLLHPESKKKLYHYELPLLNTYNTYY